MIQLNNKMVSLNLLKACDFPGFFTIKNFLIMIDGVYSLNYFLRANDKTIVKVPN